MRTSKPELRSRSITSPLFLSTSEHITLTETPLSSNCLKTSSSCNLTSNLGVTIKTSSKAFSKVSWIPLEKELQLTSISLTTPWMRSCFKPYLSCNVGRASLILCSSSKVSSSSCFSLLRNAFFGSTAFHILGFSWMTSTKPLASRAESTWYILPMGTLDFLLTAL